MTDESTIWVVAEPTVEVEPVPLEGLRSGVDRGGGWGEPGEGLDRLLARKRVPLDAQALKAQMSGLLGVVEDLFHQAEQQTHMNLDSVELTVEINGEGQVSLLGTASGKLGNKGGLTLKFTRPQ